MGWQVLICRPSDWTGRDRVAIWRRLRRCGALSLGNGTWVLSDDPGGLLRADDVDQFMQRRGCHLLRFVVADDDDRAPEVVAMVHAALDREWDRLTATLDDAEDARRALAPSDRLAALEHAYDLFVELLERDPRAGSVHEEKAVARLTELALDAEFQPADQTRGLHPGLPQTRLLSGGLAQPDGLRRVALTPFPGFAWGQAFAEFERRTYLPSPDRPPLHLGVFTFRCGDDELATRLDALATRVGVFHRSTDADAALAPTTVAAAAG